MIVATPKSWPILPAACGVLLSGAFALAPAQAASPCPNSILIQTIASLPSYTCDLGGLMYTFNNSLGSLAGANPAATLFFQNSTTSLTLKFDNLSTDTLVGFNYKILPVSETILAINQTYQLSPSLPPPFQNDITTSTLPAPPSPLTTDVQVTFEPDGNTLISLTHTIEKTPAPLPIIGTGLVFGFSRKLRRRITRAS